MKRIFRLQALIAMAVLLSCSNSNLIVDKSFLENLADDYGARSEEYSSTRGDLFAMADTIGDEALREAVQFLLAYMPLSDISLLEPEYVVEHAAAALRTREEMTWGAEIPVDVFLHFVVPPRVNNENPDNFRLVCYDELKERVAGLDVVEAALEINRWCQEKVSYQAADSRTSSPLATMLSARGRCGEESTLTVSALRTVGIPARQVYTPRWAHTDDNHAWVEFMAEGEWHYLGACEPEPVPDRGWFTEPARRAMLVHTKAFGRYSSAETIIREEPLFAEINTLDRYAVTRELRVRVTDSAGIPVPEAETGYMIYNYAEFYPLARLKCNLSGECSLKTGMGSLLIWADDGRRYGFTIASPADTLAVVSISSEPLDEAVSLDISVPPVMTLLPGIEGELVRQNNIALRRGDSIRNAYVNSWMKDVSVEDLAALAGVAPEKVEKILKASMGNYRAVATFLSSSGGRGDMAVRLLKNVSAKDLRDTPAEVLSDHLLNAPEPAPGTDTGLYYRYVLSPRISTEILSPFRSALSEIPTETMEKFRSDPACIAGWIDTEITISETENHYGTPLTPGGVLRLRRADSHSRDIFTVALCRSAGIPARLAPGTGRPQYHVNGRWHNVWFADEEIPSGSVGYITFSSDLADPVPEYHVHFSLARIDRGKYQTLNYGYGTRVSDMSKPIPLDPGQYMLTTGNRDENGNVLSSLTFFTLAPGEEKSVAVRLRELEDTSAISGKADLAGELRLISGGTLSPLSVADKGLVFIWIEPGREPTRHLLNDLPRLKSEFDAWGGYFIFLTDPERTPPGFSTDQISGTAGNTLFAEDSGLAFMTSALGTGSSGRPMPVVLCCDSTGNILFSSEGYRIGTGEQILKKIK
ncbi:MAG: transglutaminase domain-containing protein [Bacteroidales bacterium]|nr:transglutaminase domain-containing protein [Bacteroidales bacterium]MDT8372902.1 transglutaminase domain-containing protein [Bacteroidales bacterium]